MGYRSQIIAGVPKKDKKKALKIINEWDYISEGDNPSFVYFMADWWKWYEGYDEVNKFNKFIHDNKDRFLIAVGEDGALVEEIGEPYEHGVYQVTHIENGISWEKHGS